MNDTAPFMNDDDSLVSAKTQYGTEIAIYDDCFGPLWVCINSLGVFGVIRTQDWHTAYSIMGDEILKPIPEEDVLEAYGYSTLPEDPLRLELSRYWEAKHEDRGLLGCVTTKEKAEELCKEDMKINGADLQEGYSYQANATGTGIVSYDLNGESLDALTLGMIEHLGLVIEAEDPDGNRYCVTSKGDEDDK